MAVVAGLRVAPVKGLATVPVARIRLDEQGVAEDRRVFLLDAAGVVVHLRSHPHLVQAVPSLDLDAGRLTVGLPDGATAVSSLDEADEMVTAHLYGKDRAGRVLPGQAAEALSALAGEPVRVVVAEHTGVGWDEGPVSILGRASAAAVGGPERDRARYRMLVELEGTEPFEEDSWVGRNVTLGDARVRVTHQLERCVIITQSPQTGSKDWDGLHALARTRGSDLLCLGVIAEVVTPGDVLVGAPVDIFSPEPSS
jgi:uncharacterized protein YcbX